MKRTAFFLLLAFSAIASVVRADLTIVQKVDMGGTPGEMTVKIKGDKVRVDPAPQMSMITDGKTGDTITLIHGEKKAMRMSGDKMKAAAEMVKKFSGATPPATEQKPKLTPTGRKENVNGMATEVYTADTAVGKATYYIATSYPDSATILKEMRMTHPSAWSNSATSVPDFRDLPGVPLKIEMDAQGRHIVMSLVAIKRDPIPDAQFTVPADYTEMKMPDIFGGKNAPDTSGASKIPPLPQTAPTPVATP